MTNLKPCPFCGATPEIHSYPNQTFSNFMIGCHNHDCRMDVYAGGFDTKDDAIEAWNGRYEILNVSKGSDDA